MERPILLVDTREQDPLKFAPYKERFGAIVKMKLDAGDYSVLGHENAISFERKSLGDLVSTLTQPKNRDRFFRELDRLAHHRYAAIIVEASYAQVASPYQYTRVKPATVLGLLQAIQTRYNIDVIFSGSRAGSEEIMIKKIGALLV
jgi:ERCC4-type nuclease